MGTGKSVRSMNSMNKFTSWHVGISAEAYTAALFSRCGYDVSVQYCANQPEYDLIAVSGDLILKISVKGSKDGSWGLTQKYLKNADYHAATKAWLESHHKGTIFCLVQFKDTSINDNPRVYLAHPKEIAKRLDETAKGRGETILYEKHTWGPKAFASGTTDRISDEWKFSAERVEKMFELYGK